MTFDYAQKVLFKHCDPAGIVFYPRYFEMINDCVEAFFDIALGHPFETLHTAGGVPTARIESRFLAPSRHGDRIVISLEAVRLGRSSLDLAFTASCEGEVRLTASSTLVHVSASCRSEPWPDPLRRAIETFMEGRN